MRKMMAALTAMLLFLSAFSTGTAENLRVLDGPVIGIAWRADPDSEFFTNICRAVEEAG